MRCVCRPGFKNSGNVLNPKCDACPSVSNSSSHSYSHKPQTKKVSGVCHAQPLQFTTQPPILVHALQIQ